MISKIFNYAEKKHCYATQRKNGGKFSTPIRIILKPGAILKAQRTTWVSILN